MNEPIRLSAGGSPLAQQLLRAGRRERPSDDGKITAASAAIVAAGEASLALGKKAWLLRLLLLALLGGGALVLLGARLTTVRLAEDVAFVDRADDVLEPSAFVPHVPHVPPLEEKLVAPPPSASVSRGVASLALPSPLPPPVPTELDLLRQARMANASGDPASARVTLDDYVRRYPSGVLREEADALRVEVLARAGDVDGASAAAERFAKRHPTSVYLERVRAAVASARARATASPR